MSFSLKQNLRKFKWGRKLLIMLPYGWLCIFFLIPLLTILKISFSTAIIGMPPYEPVFIWAKNHLVQITLNLENYIFLFMDHLYIYAYLQSSGMAALSTLLALIIGYPMAYVIAEMTPRMQKILLLLVMLPFWTSFILRVYAWILLLSPSGLVNQFLINIGWIHSPVELLYTNFAVCIGMVYCYLPFMILPLYAALVKFDRSYLEAAADLGCKPIRRFFSITLPLTKSGIIAGCMMVFIPAVGEFVIPELLGSPDFLSIGRILWNEFFVNRDWPVASALAILLLFILCLPMLYFQKGHKKNVI